MWSVFVSLVPSAIGVSLSPIGIIELILVLFSRRARVNGVVFVLTLMVTVFAIPVVGAFAFDAVTDDSSDTPSTAKGVLLLVMGVVLMLVALRNWRNRADVSVPKVFDSIANMGPGPVFVLALGVTLFNPKNLIMLLAAGSQAGASGASQSEILVALLLFTLLATLPFIAAVAYILFGGETAKERLDGVREWLMTRNKMIMAVVLGLLAVALIGQGLTAVTG